MNTQQKRATRLAAIGLLLVFQFPSPHLKAQAADSARLWLHVENHHFFRNNEYGCNRIDGYTLPGLYLRPKLVWQVEPRVRLSTGVHWLNYWGADNYPSSGTYVSPLAEVNEENHAVHILPWVQARVDLFEWMTLVLGSIDNNDGHGMPRTLYNPELRYAADPEAGVQLMMNHPWFSADLWANWTHFIFRRSEQQEQFYTGGTIKLKLHHNQWTFHMPLHALATHTGGEGLFVRMRTRNTFNFGAGLGVTYSDGQFAADLEMMVLGFRQHRDSTIPFESGYAFSPTLRLRYDQSSLLLNYWHGVDFAPILGNPIYSNLSANNSAMSIYTNRVLTLGINYTWRHFKHCTVMFEGDLMNLFPYKIHWKDWVDEDCDSRLLVGFGVHVKLNPTVTLLR